PRRSRTAARPDRERHAYRPGLQEPVAPAGSSQSGGDPPPGAAGPSTDRRERPQLKRGSGELTRTSTRGTEGSPKKGWIRFACRHVYSTTSVRRRRSDRITGAGVTEVQEDGRFPKSGETGTCSAVRPGAAALLAAQVPGAVRSLRAQGDLGPLVLTGRVRPRGPLRRPSAARGRTGRAGGGPR